MNYASQVDKVGSIAVPPGTEVRLDWACQDAQIGYVSFNGSCKAYDAFDNCIAYNGGGSIGFYVYDYRNPIGQGFSTGGKLVGTATVHPIQQTTYTLTCNPAWAGHVEGDPLQRTRLGNQAYFGTLLPAATFSLTVNILCPTPIEDAPNNSSGYWLKRSTTRWLNNSLLGFNQCLQNISGNDYYIPAKTKPELQSFFTNASANKVPGVTVF